MGASALNRANTVINDIENEDKHAVIFSLDQEKALNKIKHTYIVTIHCYVLWTDVKMHFNSVEYACHWCSLFLHYENRFRLFGHYTSKLISVCMYGSYTL